MPIDFLNRKKKFISEIAQIFRSNFIRYRYRIILPVAVILLLTTLPGFLISFFIDKNEIHTAIKSISTENNITISLDGVVKRWYRDILLYNVRITENSNDSNQQPVVVIPEIRIVPQIFQSLKKRTLVIDKIILKEARWKYWFKENEVNQKLQEKIISLLNQHHDFKIILKNNIISLILEKKNYERQILNIFTDRGYIESIHHQVNVSIHYIDLPWGEGDLSFSPELCKECNLFHGNYNIHLKKLPLNRVSWFLDDLKFNDGYLTLKSEIKYGKVNTKSKVDSKSVLNFYQLVLTNKFDQLILRNPRIDLDLSFLNDGDKILTEYTGFWNKSPIKGTFEKSVKNIYPEKFIFSLDNRNDNPIPLVFGYKLNGLKGLQFDMHEDPLGKTYRILNGNFLTGMGSLMNEKNEVSLELPNVSLKIDHNKFTGNLNMNKTKSDLKFHFSGDIVPYARTIDTQIEFDDYRRNIPLSYNGVAFEINETGEIKSDNIYWNDIEVYYKNILEKWSASINNEQYKGWRPSIFREHAWFQKFLMRTTIQNTISINHFYRNDNVNTFVPVSGSFSFNNSIFDLQLAGNEQYLNLAIDATSSYPLIRGEYKLFFTEFNSFSGNWIPKQIISKFYDAIIDYKYMTSGERPVDLYNNYNGNGTIILNKASVKLNDNKIPEEWGKVNLDLRYFGDKIQINVNGNNETTTMNGWGTFDKKETNWNIKTTEFPGYPRNNP